MFNERNELGNLTLIKLVDIGKVRGAASFQSQSPPHYIFNFYRLSLSNISDRCRLRDTYPYLSYNLLLFICLVHF